MRQDERRGLGDTVTHERDVAWARLHDPATDAAALAEIAAAHPEFADAVARHPNAYPELIAWAGQVSSQEPARPRRIPRWALIGGAAAAGVLVLGGAGWAAAALLPGLWGGGDASSSSGAAGAVPGPTRTLAGDPVYVGDELEWFLLTPDQRAILSPGGSQTETDASYLTSGESEGAHTDVEQCIRWILTDENSIVGVRRATWQPNGTPTRAFWSAFQFPADTHADAYYRSFADTVAGCGTFRLLSGTTAYRTIGLELAAGSTDGDTFVVRETDDGATTLRAFAREGNVVVAVSVPYYDSKTPDPNTYVSVLTDLTTQARARLTDEIGYR